MTKLPIWIVLCGTCAGLAQAAHAQQFAAPRADEAELPAWPTGATSRPADDYFSGSDLPEVDMFVGETQVLAAPGVARIAVGNGRVINAAPAGDREVVVFGNAPGSSSLVIWEGNGKSKRMRINVAQSPPRRVQQEISAFLSGMRSVRSRVVGDQIIVEGEDLSGADQARIAQLARRYSQVVDFTEPIGWERMVMMDVKVVELPRTRLRELGARWDEKTAGRLTVPSPAQILALEQSGEAVVLAQPQLSARNGATASFLAGGEVPYSTVDKNGSSNTAFKPYGVSLHITPRVDRGGTVRSLIEVEASSVDPSVAATSGPALKVRRTSTEFNVRSGETVVLSGFLSREQTRETEGLPWLARIPVLGLLFGTARFEQRETELVIFVTPSIVSDANPALRERIARGEQVLDETFGPERLNVPVRPDPEED